MASHKRLKKYQLMTNGVMSGTNTITSSVVEILNLDNIYVQLNITGTPNGTISFQVSADHDQDSNGNIIVAGNWVTVTTQSVTGSAVIVGQDLNQLGASYLRVQYTNSSGSGTMNGFVSGKALE